MRVLQINAVYGSKSTGIIVKDIDCILTENEHESFVAFRDSYEKISNGYKIGNPLAWKMHALYTRITGKQSYASAISTIRFLNRIQKCKIDLIHLHNIHSNFLNFPLLLKYAERKKIPIVMTLHDSWFFTGKCYHFLDCDCEKWKIQCTNCPKRFWDIPSIFCDSSRKVFEDKKKWYKSNNVYVVGCSKWITQCAMESPLFKNANILQIYNGIDTKVFGDQVVSLRSELHLEDSFVIVTMANKWFHEKNRYIRNEVMNSLTENDKIIIVGCSENQMTQETKDARQIFLGYIKERNQLARIYSTGNVFLNLTLVDTLPTVNMEAASCGTPVITYDAGGSGELVCDGFTGYVVEPLNVTEIIESIEKIREGKIKRENCRNWAEEHFDKKKNYSEYLNLYQKIYFDKTKSEVRDEQTV